MFRSAFNKLHVSGVAQKALAYHEDTSRRHTISHIFLPLDKTQVESSMIKLFESQSASNYPCTTQSKRDGDAQHFRGTILLPQSGGIIVTESGLGAMQLCVTLGSSGKVTVYSTVNLIQLLTEVGAVFCSFCGIPAITAGSP